jgi:RNA polymerase sigma-70 factor (ECF subfamily)
LSEDPALVAKAVAGDRDALGMLLAANYERCYAVCRRILWSEEDALDATQEAMISIAKAVSRFDGRSAFSTWCYRIATNAALDEVRRTKRRPRPASDLLLAEGGEIADLSSRDQVAGPTVDRLAVAEALGRLPDEQRVAVVLRDIADLEYAEIEEVLGVPIGTVRSRIFRGRAALAEILDSQRPRSATKMQRNSNDLASVKQDRP